MIYMNTFKDQKTLALILGFIVVGFGIFSTISNRKTPVPAPTSATTKTETPYFIDREMGYEIRIDNPVVADAFNVSGDLVFTDLYNNKSFIIEKGGSYTNLSIEQIVNTQDYNQPNSNHDYVILDYGTSVVRPKIVIDVKTGKSVRYTQQGQMHIEMGQTPGMLLVESPSTFASPWHEGFMTDIVMVSLKDFSKHTIRAATQNKSYSMFYPAPDSKKLSYVTATIWTNAALSDPNGGTKFTQVKELPEQQFLTDAYKLY